MGRHFLIDVAPPNATLQVHVGVQGSVVGAPPAVRDARTFPDLVVGRFTFHDKGAAGVVQVDI